MAWTRVRVTSDAQRRHIGYYRDPAGATRSAGTFTNERAALRAGQRAERKVEDGSWYDRQAGRVTFRAYVAKSCWPSRHPRNATCEEAKRTSVPRGPRGARAWVNSRSSPPGRSLPDRNQLDRPKRGRESCRSRGKFPVRHASHSHRPSGGSAIHRYYALCLRRPHQQRTPSSPTLGYRRPNLDVECGLILRVRPDGPTRLR